VRWQHGQCGINRSVAIKNARIKRAILGKINALVCPSDKENQVGKLLANLIFSQIYRFLRQQFAF
jgi:hypothetical protein